MMSPLEKKRMGQVLALAEAIQDLGQVPAGHLYAGVMSHMSLEEFEWAIDRLVFTKLVSRAGTHLLTWIGAPKP